MRKLFLILTIFILTGCTANYNITINKDKTIDESLNINISNDEIDLTEFETVDNFIANFEDIPSDSSYEKNITKELNTVKYKFNNRYESFSTFKNSEIVTSIFDINQSSTNEYTVLTFSPGYYCTMYENNLELNATMTINISNKVIESNADEQDTKNGIYKWNFPISENVYIKYSNSEFINIKKVNNILIYGIIGIIIFLILIFVLTIKSKKVKNNQI